VSELVVLSAETVAKSELCRETFADLGVSLEYAVAAYADRPFYDTGFAKSSFLEQVLVGRIDRRMATVVADRCNLPHLRDRRSALDYGLNLVLGWLVEDAVAEWFRCAGATVKATGTDSARDFLEQWQVSQAADLLVFAGSGSRSVEVLCDWKDTWRNHDHLDLRDNKYGQLRGEEALLVGLAPSKRSALVIDLASHEEAFRRNPSIPGYGGKPGFTLDGVRRLLKPTADALGSALSIIQRRVGLMS
jgi:hypothetical protein